MKNLWFLLFFIPSLLAADISDFAEDVERAESSNTSEEEDEWEDGEENDGDDFFSQLIVELFKLIWIANNTSSTYGDFPYSENGYILWADLEYNDWTEEYELIPTGERDYWYTADLQYMHVGGIGTGALATFKGHFFRFIGPYFEAWTLQDGKDTQSAFRLGILFSLFQSDPFSMSFYGQYQRWMGVLDRQGGTYGLEYRLYPFEPLSIQIRTGVQAFENFQMGELEVQGGVVFDRFELLAGWRWWDLRNLESLLIAEYQGPYFGARVHF